MSTHNICFRGEIRKISAFFRWKKRLICCYGVLEKGSLHHMRTAKNPRSIAHVWGRPREISAKKLDMWPRKGTGHAHWEIDFTESPKCPFLAAQLKTYLNKQNLRMSVPNCEQEESSNVNLNLEDFETWIVYAIDRLCMCTIWVVCTCTKMYPLSTQR